MPRRNLSPPKYRHYRPKGLAVVRIDGRDHYLGKHGSPESWERYHRLLAEHASSAAAPASPPGAAPPPLAVVDLILAYWERRVVPYYVKDGRPTSERDNIRQALRFLRRLYGTSPAREFGPLALKAVRGSMIEAGRCRKLINKDVHRIRALFRWAASEELYPGEMLHGLLAVGALEEGRSGAKERPPVAPVPEDVVLATVARLSPQVAAMVRLQLLTAARPGEVCSVRPMDVDRSDPGAWVYRPASHKSEHHGRERAIVIGPRGQEVLRPWLLRDAGSHCFRPDEAVRARSDGGGQYREAGKRYTKDSYRVAIARACDRAFPHPTIRKARGKPLSPEDEVTLKAWRKAHRWHPHRLRHTRATEIRRAYDVEAAQVILGHSKPDTTLIYAERDLARAAEVMREIG